MESLTPALNNEAHDGSKLEDIEELEESSSSYGESKEGESDDHNQESKNSNQEEEKDEDDADRKIPIREIMMKKNIRQPENLLIDESTN
eukprot:CAMPEP_0116871066 /NCGR_PEP_ID=MMETSP0463-20121206/1262_1 /TAXON_ID=181622 /ORGANISM="Strombidinopsis sp, Strain SopsisLIS2011" /LENGTH=88 /DNA_ID=CAMNT_0004508807 /DNA_START=356 /DNA_END=622 /DNA_ORIENTATION=+